MEGDLEVRDLLEAGVVVFALLVVERLAVEFLLGVLLAAGFLIPDDDTADFLLTAEPSGLVGVLKFFWSGEDVKLSDSLIGDTKDLFTNGLLEEAIFLALVFLLAGVVVFFFLIELGVDLGLGVPLIGFEDLLAGVAVCLAISISYCVCEFRIKFSKIVVTCRFFCVFISFDE